MGELRWYQGLAVAAAPLVFAAAAPAAADPPVIVVVATTPLPGTDIDADKLAGEIQTVNLSEVSRDRQADTAASLAGARLASVSLNNETGSAFQPDLVFRGFEASPISGVAEGVAVYQDGVRLNEAFGDAVNWDLIPAFAVNSLTVQSDNPVFGLNALGGAVTLSMKDGLNFQGRQAQASAGSFGDVAGQAEYGARSGALGVYLGLGGQHDDGFREHSPTTVRQAYGDLAFDGGPLTAHLSLTAADNDIAAAGPTPVQMLAADPRAVFTWPQAVRNQAQTLALRGAWRASPTLTVSANAYYRRFEQHLTDGNTTDVAACGNDAAQLCLEGAGDYPGDALYDTGGNAVPASVLPAGATPGEIDFTHTRTDGLGATAQVSETAPLAGLGNSFTAGAAVDLGLTRYSALGELGALRNDLSVAGAGVTIDQALSPTAQPPIEAPVDVSADNTYLGLYAIDVLDLTPGLSATLSGRWNQARISLRDHLGDALNADHAFSRFNPGAGLAYKISPAVTAYAGYSEASRAPTAGELSCADPANPCLLGAFLVSDPPLKPVVARTVEAGLRGRVGGGAVSASWNLSAYRTDSADDILLLATPVNGFGYFQNAGTTRRQGLDANLKVQGRRLTLAASYAWLDASFRSPETLSSNSPSADASGLIHVRPGDRLPLNPAQRATLSADYAVSATLGLGADLRAQSSQYLAGDASNQQPPLPGYVTLELHGLMRLTPRLELFGEARNLTGGRDYSYGAFTQLDGLPPAVSLTNPRTLSPSEGRAFTVGARWRFD